MKFVRYAVRTDFRGSKLRYSTGTTGPKTNPSKEPLRPSQESSGHQRKTASIEPGGRGVKVAAEPTKWQQSPHPRSPNHSWKIALDQAPDRLGEAMKESSSKVTDFLEGPRKPNEHTHKRNKHAKSQKPKRKTPKHSVKQANIPAPARWPTQALEEKLKRLGPEASREAILEAQTDFLHPFVFAWDALKERGAFCVGQLRISVSPQSHLIVFFFLAAESVLGCSLGCFGSKCLNTPRLPDSAIWRHAGSAAQFVGQARSFIIGRSGWGRKKRDGSNSYDSWIQRGEKAGFEFEYRTLRFAGVGRLLQVILFIGFRCFSLDFSSQKTDQCLQWLKKHN